jgi:hypothetical protein
MSRWYCIWGCTERQTNRTAEVRSEKYAVRKLLKRWRWIVGIALTLLIGGGVTGWLLLQHIPDWYRPMQVPPDDLQRIRNDLVQTTDSLGAMLNETRGPFKFKFTQDQINAWLSAREAIDPQSREWLPQRLSDPMLRFEPGGVRVAATYADGDFQTVVSARLAITASSEGIKVRLGDVAGGSLGLPESFVRKGLLAFDRRVSPKLAQAGVTTRTRQHLRLADLAEGITLPNTGKWIGGGQRFRLLGIDFENGAVVVTVERLPYREAVPFYQ